MYLGYIFVFVCLGQVWATSNQHFPLDERITNIEAAFKEVLVNLHQEKEKSTELQARVSELEQEKEKSTELRARMSELEQEKEKSTELRARMSELEKEKEKSTELRARMSELEQEKEKSAYLQARMRELEDELLDVRVKLTVPRQVVARTCYEHWEMGQTEDGNYEIDPDGANNGLPPVTVFCTFMSDGATTIVPIEDVDVESMLTVQVTKCHDPGCFNVAINYTAPIKQMVALIDLSHNCFQYIEYLCVFAALEANGVAMGWWDDRNSMAQYYWTNTSENTHICTCGLTDSCVEHESFNNLCNCDANLPILQSDIGYIRNSTALPITKLSAGTYYGEAQFHLNHLKCMGKSDYTPGESCDAYRKAGATVSGYYLTLSDETSLPKVSLCDLTKSSSDTGFQTDLGPTGNFRHIVTFNAIKESYFTSVNSKLPFDKVTVNVGDAFDLDTSTFTAPLPGLYHFAFHGFNCATSSYASTFYYFYKNGQKMDTTVQMLSSDHFSTSFYEYLNENDYVYIQTAPSLIRLIDYKSDHVTQFNGNLLF